MFIYYLNFSLIFFFFMMFMFLMMMIFLLLKMKIFIEMNFLMMNSMNFSFLMYFDYKSFLFIGVVMMISSMIIIYSIVYMYMDLNYIRFIYLLVMFVISMMLMIVSQNLLSIMLGWDGLGLISYCLVIYYNNWNSYNSGMLTILTNRLGDIGLMLSIGMMSIYGDWNYLMLMKFNYLYFFFFIILGSFTKSAQIPFSSWLPQAMAAPTPISSLVHSSTLVTAGVYLIIRFSKIIMLNNNFNMIFMFLSMMTMMFSGMIASFENDLKKIIALSTLSQLGLMMMGLFMNLNLMSFMHLITHAMFKSLLFMCAGLILHSMLNNQDIRFLGCLNFNYSLTLIMFNSSNLALCGFPFMSGFYSKDLILEKMIFFNLNYFTLILFYISLMFTVIYTFRLIYYSIIMKFNYIKFFNLSDNLMMNFSMSLMFIFSIILGDLLNWLMFNSLELVFLKSSFVFFLNFLILFSMFIGLFMYLNKNFFILMKLKFLFSFMKSMWLMNLLSQFLLKNSLLLSENMMMNLEKGWMEVFGMKTLNVMYLNFMKMEKMIYMSLISIFFFFLLILII